MRDQLLVIFKNLNFKIDYFEVKTIFPKSQNVKNQNLTKDGVKWKISKSTKKRDQGMDWAVFVLRFLIYI